ncbi:FadR/GntR family transcriptional regulator [Rubrimonas cliftonensis]|uniref:Transcriptional regulator, GntR family n=1 Tax=Rubrimonas cliftonensis TaxID=89524 RepID=A0A1H4FF12_9RHOB|nr:FCD domain-containing protein [Rubrimonas cliftonensis]SEA95420.1 transcriptional regulator, GntR family [Rubrimonas cliftonensis]
MATETAALVHLRAFIADRGFGPGDRLPPERSLCAELGVGRADLRRALEAMEREGALWRHVGKGTFLSDRDAAADDMSALAKRLSPADIARARFALEPAIAREAALHATAEDIAGLRATAMRARKAATWREYEALDTQFHREVAEAAGSLALLALADQLTTLRRAVAWGRRDRLGARPPADHPSFQEHDLIVAAIASREPDGAQDAMRAHLRTVADKLFAG